MKGVTAQIADSARRRDRKRSRVEEVPPVSRLEKRIASDVVRPPEVAEISAARISISVPSHLIVTPAQAGVQGSRHGF